MKTHNKKGEKLEKYYQLLLEKYLNAQHLKLSCGITDISTSEYHIEIKKWSLTNAKHSLGQLETYKAEAWRPKLYAVFFGKISDKNKKKIIEIFSIKGIGVYEIDSKDNIIVYNEPIDHMNVD
jgi:hypothetical protein